MRTYIQILFSILMPMSMIMTIGSIVYFNLDYSFTKAMKLGVVSGVLIGLSISLIMALLLLVMKRSKKTVQQPIPVHENVHRIKKDIPLETQQNFIEQKLMLLMDKQLAFNVSLYAITDQDIGDITTNDTKGNANITVNTPEETIYITITSLTKHTAEIILKTVKKSDYVNKIISYIKEKEHSFLQY
ncbi:MAG: hypothetical protein OQK45_06770 [Sulfurovum sp.]|nr:hypothetical protein [Sulfurovum sp.]